MATAASFIARWSASICALAAAFAIAGLRRSDPQKYYSLLWALDGAVEHHPFGDLNAVLRAAFCWRHGVNVYIPNACMGGGIYNYSPLLLRLGDLPLGGPDLAGIIIALAFIASLAALPPPQRVAEFLLRIAAACSGSVLFALERGNIDVLIYLATIGGVFLLAGRLARRVTGYALFLLLAAVKFYPLTLLVLLARERLPLVLALAAAAAALVWLYFHSFGDSFAHAMRIIPHEYPFGGSFGSINLPYGLAVFFDPPVPATIDAVVNYQLPPQIRQIFKIVQILAVLPAAAAARTYIAPLARLDEPRRLLLIAGAALTAGCFFAAQNIDYRGIFLLLTLPGLAALAQRAAGPLRTRFRALTIVVPLLLWEAALRYGVTRLSARLLPREAATPEVLFWFCREILWWWVAIQLTALVLAFLWPAIRARLAELQALVAGDLTPRRRNRNLTKYL
jgi:hypothetical protein